MRLHLLADFKLLKLVLKTSDSFYIGVDSAVVISHFRAVKSVEFQRLILVYHCVVVLVLKSSQVFIILRT